MYILCRNREKNCAAASEHVFYVSANMWLLLGVFRCFLKSVRLLLKDINERLFLKENVQLIFFFLYVAAFKNISMFFNESAAASEKVLKEYSDETLNIF